MPPSHLSIPFGKETLDIQVPCECVTLRMKEMPTLVSSRDEILRALQRPIGSPGLSSILRSKGRPVGQMTVCITVSDITRPVPYKGKMGLLGPLLEIVESAGVARANILILVGNGMHRASTAEERVFMLGPEVVDRYRILDHDCEDASNLVFAVRTAQGTEVYVNRHFLQADCRIVTGLVESHFMAGASGGRKGVCPALVNTRTLERFHGPRFLEHPAATNLVLDGNPCHEEALEVARKIGVDFLVNATLNSQLRMTGVFAGDLVEAHLAAFEVMRASVEVPIQEPFDIVLTHGGYVGRNHYQCAKAAVGAMPAVRDQGMFIIAANNSDAEPVGSLEYRTLLHLFKILGPDRYVSVLNHPDWVFTKDQWQPEVWGRPLRKVGPDGLIYCAPQIRLEDRRILPGLNGYDLLDMNHPFESDKDKATAMVQQAVNYAVSHPRFQETRPTMAFIEEGPYAIPIRK
ncbi:MAG: nickel-dependent lactate racemase [Planctomycetes bacterium]|nr:nickel-dependent lactate racemase [Planctomycetota bacterium]